jgi:sulfur relay (sulfurtransferase) DsrC/TusE family protein
LNNSFSDNLKGAEMNISSNYSFSNNDKIYSVDELGYLINPSDWDENFAIGIAKEMDISLTEEHCKVINFILH